MKLHYRIQTVLASTNTTALTLSPVEWGRDSAEEWIEVEGEAIPAWEACDPSDPHAEPLEPGGKMTELRIDGACDWRPGTFLTMTVEETDSSWSPG